MQNMLTKKNEKCTTCKTTIQIYKTKMRRERGERKRCIKQKHNCIFQCTVFKLLEFCWHRRQTKQNKKKTLKKITGVERRVNMETTKKNNNFVELKKLNGENHDEKEIKKERTRKGRRIRMNERVTRTKLINELKRKKKW